MAASSGVDPSAASRVSSSGGATPSAAAVVVGVARHRPAPLGAVDGERGRALEVGPRVRPACPVVAGDGIVPAGLLGEALRVGRRARGVEGDAVEVALRPAVAGADQVRLLPRLVDGHDPGHNPGPRRQRPGLGPGRIADLEVPEAGGLRRPEDSAIGERAGVVVEIDPWIAALDPHRLEDAVGRQAVPAQLVLLARQRGHEPAAVRMRHHAREIAAAVDVGQPHLPHAIVRRGRRGPNTERHRSVRPAGEWVAMGLVVARRPAGVGDGERRDGALVDVGEGQVLAVPAPPQPLVAVELLGGGVLREPVRQPIRGVRGDLPWTAVTGKRHHPHVALSDDREPRAVRREDRGGGALHAGHRGQRAARRGIADADQHPSPGRHRDRRTRRARRPGVLGDPQRARPPPLPLELLLARERLLALGRVSRPGEEHPLAGGQVVTPQGANLRPRVA
jgi:hypothetical protein